MVAENPAENNILDYYLTEGRESLQIEMEAIRKKMASLRVALEESQETKLDLEKKLKDERDRADTVGRVYSAGGSRLGTASVVGWANACRLAMLWLDRVVNVG